MSLTLLLPQTMSRLRPLLPKGIKEKLHAFDVELHDQGGLAGSGTHTRAIVKTERLMQGAVSRVNA